MTAAQRKGSAFERLIADALAWHLRDDRIDRRVKTGAHDKGDVANVRLPSGHRLVVECKNTNRTELAQWVNEAAVERDNDAALAGVVIHKRRGHGDPLDQYVTMTMRDLVLIGWGLAPNLENRS